MFKRSRRKVRRVQLEPKRGVCIFFNIKSGLLLPKNQPKKQKCCYPVARTAGFLHKSKENKL